MEKKNRRRKIYPAWRPCTKTREMKKKKNNRNFSEGGICVCLETLASSRKCQLIRFGLIDFREWPHRVSLLLLNLQLVSWINHSFLFFRGGFSRLGYFQSVEIAAVLVKVPFRREKRNWFLLFIVHRSTPNSTIDGRYRFQSGRIAVHLAPINLLHSVLSVGEFLKSHGLLEREYVPTINWRERYNIPSASLEPVVIDAT